MQIDTPMQNMKNADRALRQIASNTLKALNLITNTSVTDLANKVRLHRTNISTFINQDRLEVLGWSSIRRLLRVYGLGIEGDGLSILRSEACPEITFPVTSSTREGIASLIEIFASSGFTCQFRAFEIGSDENGIDTLPTGGAFYAQFDTNIWAAVSLDRMSPNVAEAFSNNESVNSCEAILIAEDLFMSWEDSAPHRSEVLAFYKPEVAQK